MKINKLFTLVILICSFAASAEMRIDSIILKDNTIIQNEDISSLDVSVDGDLNSIELFNNTIIDSSEVQSIKIKPYRFNREIQDASRAVLGNGNGSGG